VSPRASLDTVVSRKNSQPLPGLEPAIIHPVAQRYTTELWSVVWVSMMNASHSATPSFLWISGIRMFPPAFSFDQSLPSFLLQWVLRGKHGRSLKPTTHFFPMLRVRMCGSPSSRPRRGVVLNHRVNYSMRTKIRDLFCTF
jgi:hypothetical protein